MNRTESEFSLFLNIYKLQVFLLKRKTLRAPCTGFEWMGRVIYLSSTISGDLDAQNKTTNISAQVLQDNLHEVNSHELSNRKI